MKKSLWNRLSRVIALFTALALAAGMATGCTPEKKTWTVTFYDGDKVIATKTVEDGGRVEEFSPEDVGYEKAGYSFHDWYATSDYAFPFDFTKAVDKDTNVYSQWLSDEPDTRQWLIAGESSAGGPLKTIGWNGGAVNEDGVTNILTKAEGKNEFVITLNLYAGDRFQFCVQEENGAWVEENGKTVARGGKFLQKNDYMASESGGLGDGQANIVVSQSGNYTLTLTTDATDENVGAIAVKRNGDAPQITIDRTAYTWYLYGASKSENADSVLKDMNWGQGVTDAKPYQMLRVSDNEPDGTGSWLITAKFDAGDEFLLAFVTVKSGGLSAESGTLFGYDAIQKFNGNEAKVEKAGMGGNIGIKVKGTYTLRLTVTLNETTNTLEGAVELIDNAQFLKAEQEWIVFGNRLNRQQIKDLLEMDLTEEQYAVYTSDLKDNKWGLGTDVKKLTKVTSPAAGAVQYTVTLTLGVGDYFYFGIPITVNDLAGNHYATAGYLSTAVPAYVAEMPAGLGSVWTHNFACKAAGSYTFTVTVDENAAISVAVTANS